LRQRPGRQSMCTLTGARVADASRTVQFADDLQLMHPVVCKSSILRSLTLTVL
jgi:hypothetical protein